MTDQSFPLKVLVPALHPIKAIKATFLSLLPQQRLFIPELQRPFVWKKDRINDFIKDVMQLVTLQSSQPQTRVEHFFGTVVLQNTLDPRGIAIIDGQQRLTAVNLILGLLKAEMNILKVAVWISQNKHLTCALSRAVYECHQSNDWTTSDIEDREDSITQHACKVFSF